MDTITKILAGPAVVWAIAVCVAGVFSIGLGVYWLLNKRSRLRDLAELRKKLDDLAPSDPEYGAVRAIYTSLTIDAERWGFYHSGSGSHSDGANADHSGGNHAGDGDPGGGHH